MGLLIVREAVRVRLQVADTPAHHGVNRQRDIRHEGTRRLVS